MTKCISSFVLVAALLFGGCISTHNELSDPQEWHTLGAERVLVAKDGFVLPIVTDDHPRNRWAAMFLANIIEGTCGNRPPVLVEFDGQHNAITNALYIGNVGGNRGWRCELSGKSTEAFRVVVKEGSVRFLGRADFAVFDWCERALKFRFYGAGGESVIPSEVIEAEGVDYSDCPVFEHRVFDWRLPGSAWMRFAKAGSSHRGGVAVHQPHGWFTNATIRAEHPRIFETGLTPMLCYGNPETLEYYKYRITRHIAGMEDSAGIVDSIRKVVTVSQWDAPIKCECEYCRGKSAAEIIWGQFLRPLSEWLKIEHPDYMISFLPYLNTCEVPDGLRLPGNAEAEVCTMPGMALLKNQRTKLQEETLLRQWQSVTGRKVLSWNYGCWPRDFTSAPYVFGRTAVKHCMDMRETLCGAFVCGGGEDPRIALSMYVWLKALWNPDFDVDAVYDEFAERMFGAAAKPMRELIELQEHCWNRPWENDRCDFNNIFRISFPADDILRMKVLLRKAYSLVDNDANARTQIIRYAAGMQEFFNEANANAQKTSRTVSLGSTNEMIVARSADYLVPWAKTKVITAREDDSLVIEVRCDEPAIAAMDFAQMVEDYVWDNDNVSFAFELDGQVKLVKVYLTGEIRNGFNGFEAKVDHDEESWTVRARLKLNVDLLKAGVVRGNVGRWRVGDRRAEESSRVVGSIYEHSRLDTRYTCFDDDVEALVNFSLRK